MIEVCTLMLAFLAGGSLGVIFFGGLWWTIRGGLSSRRPAAWFLISLGLRVSIAVGGFYWVVRNDWRNAVACLLGFLAARTYMTWLTRVTRASTP